MWHTNPLSRASNTSACEQAALFTGAAVSAETFQKLLHVHQLAVPSDTVKVIMDASVATTVSATNLLLRGNHIHIEHIYTCTDTYTYVGSLGSSGCAFKLSDSGLRTEGSRLFA